MCSGSTIDAGSPPRPAASCCTRAAMHGQSLGRRAWRSRCWSAGAARRSASSSRSTSGRCRRWTCRAGRRSGPSVRAVRGISSPTWTPVTDVAMGLKSPRISGGASGLGSHVSCCGGPPRWNRTMHAFALPVVAPAVRADRAPSSAGSDSPKALSPPTRSHSRRVRPSHNRGPLPRMLHTANLPLAWAA